MENKSIDRITQIHLKNFRCFSDKKISFEKPVVVLEGDNGVGKTTLLEALHYACFLKSFRASSPRDLITFGQNSFFLKMQFEASDGIQMFEHEIQVGFSDGKRLVKLDKKSISSYKELMDHYRVISLVEDDLELIKGGPIGRRTFIDQALLLTDPAYAMDLRQLRQIVLNRNAWIAQRKNEHKMYAVFTKQLWDISQKIQKRRIDFVDLLLQKVTQLKTSYFEKNLDIHMTYSPKKELKDFDTFIEQCAGLKSNEMRMGRSLFGAHLDDIHITLYKKKSRIFASRGQQKLIVLLVKMAQLQLLLEKPGSTVFLLDDFMTDFDYGRSKVLLDALQSLNCHLIFSTPVSQGPLYDIFSQMGAQRVLLTH